MSIVRNYVRNMVVEAMQQETENQLRDIVREEVVRHLATRLNENGKDTKKKKKDSNVAKRRSVMRLLKDPKLKHSEIMRKLYGVKPGTSEDDAMRSLFSKKVSGKPDADGQVRTFTDSEINKLYNILA